MSEYPVDLVAAALRVADDPSDAVRLRVLRQSRTGVRMQPGTVQVDAQVFGDLLAAVVKLRDGG